MVSGNTARRAPEREPGAEGDDTIDPLLTLPNPLPPLAAPARRWRLETLLVEVGETTRKELEIAVWRWRAFRHWRIALDPRAPPKSHKMRLRELAQQKVDQVVEDNVGGVVALVKQSE